MCRLNGTVVPTNSEPEPVETVQYHQQRVSTPTKQVGCSFFDIVSTSTKQVDYFFFVSCVPLSVHCASIIMYKFYQRASMPLLLLCAIPFCLLWFSLFDCPTAFVFFHLIPSYQNATRLTIESILPEMWSATLDTHLPAQPSFLYVITVQLS